MVIITILQLSLIAGDS